MRIIRIALLSCLIFAAGAEQSPPDLSSVMAQAEAKLADHDSAGALLLLRAAVAKNPASAELRVAFGTVCLRAGEYDEGIAAYQAILSQPANNPQASGDLYLRIGEAYRRKGDFESAIVNLQRSVELRPENVIGRNTLALVLDRAGKEGGRGTGISHHTATRPPQRRCDEQSGIPSLGIRWRSGRSLEPRNACP